MNASSVSPYVSRPRVDDRIAAGLSRRVTVIAAPLGYGKSVAIRAFLRARPENAIVFAASHASGDVRGFLRGVSDAMAKRFPSAQLSFIHGAELAAGGDDPRAAARWLRNQLAGREATIVLDELHAIDGAPEAVAFVDAAIEAAPPGVHFVLGTRSAAGLPLADWLSRDVASLTIDESILGFDRAEALRLNPALDAATADRYFSAMHGWPAGLALALRAGRPFVAASGPSVLLERLVRELVAELDDDERETLERTIVLPDLDPRVVAGMGIAQLDERLARLRADVPAFFEHEPGDVPRYAGALAAVLTADLIGREVLVTYTGDAVRGLMEAQRFSEAIDRVESLPAFERAPEIAERYGVTLVERSRFDVLDALLRRIDPELDADAPALGALRALQESQRGHFDSAEAFFIIALDRPQAPRTRDELVYRYGLDLVRRGRGDEAARLIERHLQTQPVAREMRAPLHATLATAQIVRGNRVDAWTHVDLALATRAEVSNGAVRARIAHQAAYVALNDGDYERAKTFAAEAVALARAAGADDIAARAYTVLYNIAYTVEDDVLQGLEYLKAFDACAVRTSDVELRVFALLAAFDIEVELADDVAIAQTEAALRESELAQHQRKVAEALLPAQALRAAWRGEFSVAYQLLAPNAAHHRASSRRAQILSELAIYAAAAGLAREALEAITLVHEELLGQGLSEREALRARINLACAAVLLGRSDNAADALEEIRRESGIDGSTRVRADAAAAYVAFARGSGRREARERLRAAIAALHHAHLGGFARLLEAFPGHPSASET